MTLNAVLDGASQFFVSREMATYERDGKQTLQLNFLLLKSETLLFNQLHAIYPKTPSFGWISVSIGVSKLACQLIQKMGESFPYPLGEVSNSYFSKKAVERVVSFASACDSFLEGVLNHSDFLSNGAYLISCVALIYLGHEISGAIGIGFLALIVCKKYSLLPGYIEKKLDFIHPALNVHTLFVSPNLLFRLFAGIDALVHLGRFIAKREEVSAFIDSLFEGFKPGVHSIAWDKKIKNYSTVGIETITSQDAWLSLNRTSIHALKVGQVLSPTQEKEIESLSFEQLYEILEARLEGITYDSEGWNRIKKVAFEGVSSEELPPNYQMFSKLLKAIFYSISKETDLAIQKRKIQEIGAIGSSCPEGWIKDLTFLENDQEKDIAWCIHHRLAQLRDQIVYAKILKIQEEDPSAFASCGGATNAHLHDQVSGWLWHKWRTFRGEVYFSLYQRNLLLSYLQLPIKENSILGEKERDSILLGLFIEPSLILAIESLVLIDFELRFEYSSSRIIQEIYSQIKPQYIEVKDRDGKYALESSRGIQWDAICGWISDLYSRDISLLADDGSYKPRWIGIDLHGKPYLTIEGVRLLLWDLGVLEPEVVFLDELD